LFNIAISNAVVERIFLNVTLSKTLLRNRIKLRILDALLCINTNFNFKKERCSFLSCDNHKTFAVYKKETINESKVSVLTEK